MSWMEQQLFPPPETQLEATSYLAHLDRLIAAEREDPGSGRMLDLLVRWRRAVEMTYRLLPESRPPDTESGDPR